MVLETLLVTVVFELPGLFSRECQKEVSCRAFAIVVVLRVFDVGHHRVGNGKPIIVIRSVSVLVIGGISNSVVPRWFQDCTDRTVTSREGEMPAPVVDAAYKNGIEKARRDLRAFIAMNNCAPLMVRLA